MKRRAAISVKVMPPTNTHKHGFLAAVAGEERSSLDGLVFALLQLVKGLAADVLHGVVEAAPALLGARR